MLPGDHVERGYEAGLKRLQESLAAAEAANKDALAKNGAFLAELERVRGQLGANGDEEQRIQELRAELDGARADIKSLKAKLDARGDAQAAADREAERPMNLVPEYAYPCVACGEDCSTWMVLDAQRLYICMADWHSWRASEQYARWFEYTRERIQNFADNRTQAQILRAAQKGIKK